MSKKRSRNLSDWDEWWCSKADENKLPYLVWNFFVLRAYRRLLSKVHLDAGSHILEVGCGSGQTSLAIAKVYGCSVTLVDKSDKALARASSNFARWDIQANFIQADVLQIRLKDDFDLVHSEGLIEHFVGQEMVNVMRFHETATKPGGYVLTFAPAPTVFYKLSSWAMRITGNWYFGYETPLSLRSHMELHEDIGLSIVGHTHAMSREIGVLGKKVS